MKMKENPSSPTHPLAATTVTTKDGVNNTGIFLFVLFLSHLLILIFLLFKIDETLLTSRAMSTLYKID